MYKIVSLIVDKKMSHCPIENGSVEYIPGEWVGTHQQLAAVGYHLLVFEEYEHVEKFFGHPGPYIHSEVWECDVREIIDNPPQPWVVDWDGVGTPRILKSPTDSWCLGTIMVKEVKLTKQVA